MKSVGDININGIEGTLEVSSDKGKVYLSINKLDDGTRSLVNTDGKLHVKIDPEVRLNFITYKTMKSSFLILYI